MSRKGIHIERLTKRYGSGDTAFLALKDVNCTWHRVRWWA